MAENTNAANPKIVRAMRRQEKKREEARRAAIREVMATPVGRMFVWDLLERSGIFKSVMALDATIYYNAGRQDFGKEIMAVLLEVGDDQFEVMQREARERTKRDERERDALIETATTEEKD